MKLEIVEIEIAKIKTHRALAVFALLVSIAAIVLALLAISNPGPSGPPGPEGPEGPSACPVLYRCLPSIGTIPPTNEPPANTYTLTTAGSESLATIARKNGVSVQDVVQNTTQLGGASNHQSFWKWYKASNWSKTDKVPANTILFFESPASAGKVAVR